MFLQFTVWGALFQLASKSLATRRLNWNFPPKLLNCKITVDQKFEDQK